MAETAVPLPCERFCDKHPVCRLLNDQPIHYFDCDRFQTYGYGLRQGECDCTATADVNEAAGSGVHSGLPAERGGQRMTAPDTAPNGDQDRIPTTAARRCLNCDLPVTRSRLFCGRCDRTLGVREREALYPKEKR